MCAPDGSAGVWPAAEFDFRATMPYGVGRARWTLGNLPHGTTRLAGRGLRRNAIPRNDAIQREEGGRIVGKPAAADGAAGGCGAAENAISCSYPMRWGAGQQRRIGRGRTGWHGWRVWRGGECDFAQLPYAMGSGAIGSRVGQVRAGWHGWPLRRGGECDFAQRPYAMGSGPAEPGLAGFGPDRTAGGGDGAQNAISRSDPMQWGSRPAEPGWPGSGWMARLAAAMGGECNFAQRPYAMGEPASRAGLAGLGLDGTGWRLRRAENAISRSYPMQWGGGQQSRVGRVRTGWHGWRAWRTTDAISARRCHTEPATGRLTRWWSGPGGSWGKAAASGRPGRRWRTAESDFRAGSPRRGGRASLPPGTCAG
jgi:hypothetical protein